MRRPDGFLFAGRALLEARFRVLASVESFTIVGVEALRVIVEVDVGRGLPCLEVVGLPGAAVREAKDRVRAAVQNSGFAWPLGRITVNLAPAHVPKGGTFFDLPIALGILAASGQAPAPEPGTALVGELSLDGRVRAVRGALCIGAAMKGGGLLTLPEENVPEVRSVPGLRYLGVSGLRDLVEKLGRQEPGERSEGPAATGLPKAGDGAWHHVKGQRLAKRALTIAAAGGHHTLLVGPPGAGKTMLARAMADLLAPLTPEEVIEVSAIYSVAGMLTPERPLVLSRPFRAPHHTVTPTALLGGGNPIRPGEVSLAHRGVLFLDEFPEFQQAALEGLREPLEDGAVVISRASGSHRLPAEFTLVAAANPCPCGYHGDPKKACTCSPASLERYRRRLSGPLMDRIDLFVYVARPEVEVLLGGEKGRKRTAGADAAGADEPDWPALVDNALKAQERRFSDKRRRNGSMTPREVALFAELDAESRALLGEAAKAHNLSPRAIHRVLKVSRTIADLEGRRDIAPHHVAEALYFRLEQVFSREPRSC